MLKKIRLLLEYGCYPVWLYDDHNDIIDTLLPEELRSDSVLDSRFGDLQARYDALFIDNSHEFSYVGFTNREDYENFVKDWNDTVSDFVKKINGRYIIQNDVDLDNI